MNAKDLTQELERLRKENEILNQEVNHLKKRLRNAQDPTPIDRVSFRRLVEIARLACLDIKRLGRGSKILVKMGRCCQRVFKNLRDAWEFLSQEEWALHDLFPDLPGHTPPPSPTKQRSQPHCKYCGDLIQWALGVSGWLPFNPDGNRHRCNRTHWDAQKLSTVPFGS